MSNINKQFAFLFLLLAACDAERAADDVSAGSIPPSAWLESDQSVYVIPGGAELSLQGGAEDPDGTIVEYMWRDAKGRVVGNQAEIVWRPPAAGTTSLTFAARDDSGNWSHPAGVVVVSGEVHSRPHAIRLNSGGLQDDGRVKIPVDYVAIGRAAPAADIGAGDFTIEFWLRGDGRKNQKPVRECGEGIAWIYGNIVLDRDRYGKSRKYGVSLLGGRPAFGVSGDGDLTLCAEQDVLDGKWHHLAFTRRRNDGEMSIFIDGYLVARQQGPGGDISYPDDEMPESHCSGPCFRSDPFLVIGAEKHDVGPEYPGFTGLLDELRLSDMVRYDDHFSVPREPFAADANTSALYHFDEGEGLVVADSAGRGPASNGILRIGGRPRGPTFDSSSTPFGEDL